MQSGILENNAASIALHTKGGFRMIGATPSEASFACGRPATGAPAAIFTLLGGAVIALGASAAAVLRRRTVRLAELSALS